MTGQSLHPGPVHRPQAKQQNAHAQGHWASRYPRTAVGDTAFGHVDGNDGAKEALAAMTQLQSRLSSVQAGLHAE